MYWKENKNNTYKLCNDSYPQKILSDLCSYFENAPHNLQFGKNLHYTLICYVFEALDNNIFDYEDIQEKVIWLLKKNKQNKKTKENFKSTLLENSITTIDMGKNCYFASIWGARMLLCSNDIQEFIDSYMHTEAKTQGMWLLISLMNDFIDNTLEADDRSDDKLFELIDKVYDVMRAEAEFMYLNARTTHRYEIEMQDQIYNISNLRIMVTFFLKKAELLERKIKMHSERIEKQHNANLNLILNIMTVVGSISAIFQIVNYLLDSPKNNIISIVASLVTIITLFGILFIKKHIDKISSIRKSKKRK